MAKRIHPEELHGFIQTRQCLHTPFSNRWSIIHRVQWRKTVLLAQRPLRLGVGERIGQEHFRTRQVQFGLTLACHISTLCLSAVPVAVPRTLAAAEAARPGGLVGGLALPRGTALRRRTVPVACRACQAAETLQHCAGLGPSGAADSTWPACPRRFGARGAPVDTAILPHWGPVR